MTLLAARFVPVLVDFPADPTRAQSWGRFMELRPDGGRIVLRGELPEQASLRLGFELFGESLQGIAASVLSCSLDDDGYSSASLRFSDEKQRAVLGRVLRRLSALALPDEPAL